MGASPPASLKLNWPRLGHWTREVGAGGEAVIAFSSGLVFSGWSAALGLTRWLSRIQPGSRGPAVWLSLNCFSFCTASLTLSRLPRWTHTRPNSGWGQAAATATAAAAASGQPPARQADPALLVRGLLPDVHVASSPQISPQNTQVTLEATEPNVFPKDAADPRAHCSICNLLNYVITQFGLPVKSNLCWLWKISS